MLLLFTYSRRSFVFALDSRVVRIELVKPNNMNTLSRHRVTVFAKFLLPQRKLNFLLIGYSVEATNCEFLVFSSFSLIFIVLLWCNQRRLNGFHYIRGS